MTKMLEQIMQMMIPLQEVIPKLERLEENFKRIEKGMKKEN
jgi:uncharacterized protein (UPF0335 family)